MSLRSFMDGTAKQRGARGARRQRQPDLNTADTIQCVTCHVSTTILPDRAMVAGVDVTDQPVHLDAVQSDANR